MIALNTDSLFILLQVDFLTEKFEKINQPEKAEKLKNIKKRAGEEKIRAMEHLKNKHQT